MTVHIYLPPRPSPLRTFDEVVDTIQHGLKTLAATGFVLPDRSIFLAAHLLPWGTRSDDRRILYNFEQHDSPLLDNSSLHLFRQHEVWDYSPSNVAWLKARGVRAKHVPLGYVPELTRIKKAQPDIDVLFYGLVNTRRRCILDDLRAAGLNVVECDNCYGRERDALIGRSKVVLNVHFYETAIFEMVRCSYLFANKVCVVSEDSVDVPPELIGEVPFAPYEKLVDTCVRLVHDTDEAADWAERAHKAFRTCDETAILRGALQTRTEGPL